MQLWLALVPRHPPQKKLQAVISGNWDELITKTAKFSYRKLILAVKIGPKFDSDFNFFSFYNVIILATIMITCQSLVFFIVDQAYFENDAKLICDLKGTWSY